MAKKKVNYSVGLDIGTGSVGWAVTDGNYHLLKKGNRNLWGADLFPSAKSAAERRLYRGARRRYIRRKNRICLLQELTKEMVGTVDEHFFERLEYSYLTKADRKETDLELGEHSILFSKNFDEKKYHEDYKTIYHLRYHLCNSDEKADPRLIYMALHHIIKYRGNFLYQGQKLEMNNTEDIENKLKEVFEYFDERDSYCFSNVDVKRFIAIAKNKKYSLSKIKEELNVLYQGAAKDTKVYKELILALIGYKFDPNKLFPIENKKIAFRDAEIDEELDQLEGLIGEDISVVRSMQEIYSYLTLVKLVSVENDAKNGKYSSSMIALFEKHKKDLRILKETYKKIGEAEYRNMFKEKNGENNYWCYIHSPKKAKIDDLYAKISKAVKNHSELGYADYILTEIDNHTFLPKQNSVDNSIVPYQMNEAELKEIIDHQKKYYPELEKNESKILSLLTFRIPYYVGPLTTPEQGNPHSWIIKKDKNGIIRPWNYEEVIDLDATAAEFINRMRNHCTYLLGEYTLPKNSLLESEFEVLNELNKITVDGKTLEQDAKKAVIQDLFLKNNEVTEDKLRKYLINHNFVKDDQEHIINGFQKDGKFSTSLKPWRDFIAIYGEEEFYKRKDEIETIIEYLTIYNDKKIIQRRIKNDGFNLSEVQLKKILNKSYTGYGRLSRQLIDGMVGKDLHGNPATIIEVLRSSDLNFMQVINNSKLGFKELINEANEEDLDGSLTYDRIAELAASPALKRGIWQSIRVVRDIVKYMGHNPENIFIEFAREDGEKGKRTVSRLKSLQNLYNKMIENKDDINGETIDKKDEIYKELTSESDDLDDKRFLYYIQHGKSMYSGKPLNINELANYEIDHVLPQSYVKDDSLENRVLVLKEENQLKGGDLLLKPEVISKMTFFWLSLVKSNLISSKKFANLTRTAISERQQLGFISRQLVETRQICVHVANFLNTEYKDTKVISSKAGTTSEFRHKYDLYKCRTLNKVHHAHDAYLACVLGAYTIHRYPYMLSDQAMDSYSKIAKDIKRNIEEDHKNDYKQKYGWIVRQLGDKIITDNSTGEVLWDGAEEIQYIKKVLNYKDYFLNFVSREDDGQLFNATIYSPKGSELKNKTEYGVISIKKDRDYHKYGGYTSITVAKGVAVKYEKGKKQVSEVIPVPIYIRNENEQFHYLMSICKTEKITILQDHINLGQQFIQDGCRYLMQSPSEWKCVEQIFLDHENTKTLYCIEKHFKTDDDSLMKLLNAIKEQINKKIPHLVSKTEKIDEDLYRKLSTKEKSDVILSMLTGVNGLGTNLSVGSFKVSPNYGRVYNKQLNVDKVTFIYTSPSGIYSTMKKL